MSALGQLTELTLAGAARAVAQREITPLELVEAHLARIDEVGPRVNAFITVDRDGALAAARARLAELEAGGPVGPLHGVPVTLKDNIPVAGLRATVGSRPFADYVPDRDAPVARRLREAGAIVLGKTNMHEFACGGTSNNPFYGAVRNPWDLERSPAGSSGGCAAAVSARLSPLSLGTDAGGSVRFPAAVTGLVGMRPTAGRVPATVLPGPLTTDAIGPLTRTVEDNALALDVLTGYDPSDPTSVRGAAADCRAALASGVAGLRVATIAGLSTENVQPAVRAALETTLDQLAQAGAERGEVALEHLDHLVPAIGAILSVETTALHRRMVRERPEDYSDDVRSQVETGELITGADYVQAQRYRTLLRATLLAAFERADALLLPTQPFTALPIGVEEVELDGVVHSRPVLMLRCSAPAALAGLPAVSVPAGLDERGLPIGMQLMGRPFEEGVLYRLAAAIETATGFPERVPPL